MVVCTVLLVAAGMASPLAAGPATRVDGRRIPTRVVLGATLDLPSIRADYWSVLSLLAANHAQEAVNALTRLERRALSGSQPELLVQAEVEVAERLAEKSPESLVPVIRMHGATLTAYLESASTIGLTHAVTAACRLASLYERRSVSSEARVDAADLLAGLFVELANHGAHGQGADLFEAALSCDPDAPAVHLLAGARDELEGRYKKAVDHFRRAVELQPDDPVMRLRLAVNLRRTGRGGDAVAHLERCLAPDGPRWIRIVAAQERARVAMENGDWAGAVRVLEEVIPDPERTPGVDALLAYAHDRLGEPREAERIAELVMTETDGAAPSARLSYARWPVAGEAGPSGAARLEPSPVRAAALSDALQRMQAPPVER